MGSVDTIQTPNYQYKIGFSLDEFNQATGGNLSQNEIEKILLEKRFEYKIVVVREALEETIPKCMNAIYKNPSSMRLDAPNAFSCSSLVSFIYTQAGVWMPSLSIDKYVFGKQISFDDLQFGDLIFSNSGIGAIRTETVEYKPGTKVPEGVDHVALYLGNKEILHATKKYGKVVKEDLKNLENISMVVGFRRVANIDEKRFVVTV